MKTKIEIIEHRFSCISPGLFRDNGYLQKHRKQPKDSTQVRKNNSHDQFMICEKTPKMQFQLQTIGCRRSINIKRYM